MNAIQISLDEIKSGLFFMSSVFCVFIENMKRLLANSDFKIIPIIISHEVVKSVSLENLGKFPEEALEKNAT